MRTEVTEQNRIDDMNEVIAIFDGWEKEIRKGIDCFIKDGRLRYHYELKYHEDWNQLMGVVEKIESLGYKFQICRKRVTIIEDTGVQLHVLTVKESKKIATVHKAAYDFIQWYQLSIKHL